MSLPRGGRQRGFLPPQAIPRPERLPLEGAGARRATEGVREGGRNTGETTERKNSFHRKRSPSLEREADRTPSAAGRANRKTPGPYRAFFDPREDMNALPRAKGKSRPSVPGGFWGRSFFEYVFPDPCPFKKSFAFFSSEKKGGFWGRSFFEYVFPAPCVI